MRKMKKVKSRSIKLMAIPKKLSEIKFMKMDLRLMVSNMLDGKEVEVQQEMVNASSSIRNWNTQ